MVSAAELLGTSLTNSVVSGSGITYPGPDAEQPQSRLMAIRQSLKSMSFLCMARYLSSCLVV